MPYLNYEQIAVSDTVLTIASFTVPANATMVEVMGTAGVRYTMDNATDPTTTSGMLLRAADEPKVFLIEDLTKIRLIRDGVADTTLEVHYMAGRDV